MGVEEGLLVGWKGAGGMGSVAWGRVKDADQRLRRREVTLKHIFQKNAIEFETRATSNEQRATRHEQRR